MKPIRIIYNSRILLPGRLSVITLGHRILTKRSYISHGVLSHEIVHVDQWERYGWTFPFRYMWAWVLTGFTYFNNKFEVEARERAYAPEIQQVITDQNLLP